MQTAMALLGAQCKEEVIEQAAFQVIHNASGYPVDLVVAWETDSVVYAIPNGDSLLVSGICYGPIVVECAFDWEFETANSHTLSTYVLFDEARVKYFPTDGCGGERQLVGAYGGTPEECGYDFTYVRNQFAYVFTLTAEDYDTAQLIEE